MGAWPVSGSSAKFLDLTPSLIFGPLAISDEQVGTWWGQTGCTHCTALKSTLLRTTAKHCSVFQRVAGGIFWMPHISAMHYIFSVTYIPAHKANYATTKLWICRVYIVDSLCSLCTSCFFLKCWCYALLCIIHWALCIFIAYLLDCIVQWAFCNLQCVRQC